jgi:hypothetical protein
MAEDEAITVKRPRLEQTFRSFNAVDGAAFWHSLTHLLGRLTALTDIIFDVFAQFPPGALEALHRNNLYCRLHITKFRLQSLANGQLEPYDLQLITSSCLYSVSIYIIQYRSGLVYDYNWDAAFNMIEGAAPRLEHVRIIDQFSKNVSTMDSSRRLPRHPPSQRRRLCEISSHQVQRRPIRSFGYNGPLSDIIPEFIEILGIHGLRALEILPCYQEDGEVLKMLGTIGGLDTLERLRVRTIGRSIAEDNALQTLLRQFGRLRSLYLWSNYDIRGCLKAASTTSGGTLRELNVGHMLLDAAMVLMLTKSFSGLHSICFRMERTLSLPPETDIYTALARFPELQSVTLIMKYRRDTRAPLRMWDHGRRLQNILDDRGREKARRLSNMAINTDLVRQIWREITRDRPRLATFTLKITYDKLPDQREDFDYNMYVDYDFLRPEWLVRARPADNPQEMEITNLDTWRPIREPEPYYFREHDIHLLDVYKALWPSRKDGAAQLEDWWSLPLQFRRDMDDWSMLPCKCPRGGWYTCCRKDELL